MTWLSRILLSCVGAISTLGAIWFLGDSGTYVGLIGGLAMLLWASFWSVGGLGQLLNTVLIVISVASTSWVVVVKLANDPSAVPVALLFALIAAASALVWFKQRTQL